MNNNCYYIDQITTDKGLLDNVVDLVIILTMHNSDRINNIKTQLNRINLHKNIIIQYNHGYKLCEKNLLKQNSVHDLNNANYHAMKLAKQMNTNYILLLEDDFILSKELINNNNIINDLLYFKKTTDFNILGLGSMFILKPLSIFNKFKKCFSMTMAHANIYDKYYINNYINDYENNQILTNHDLYFYKYKLYIYYKPLIFQVIEKTENSYNWEIFNIKTNKIIFKLHDLLNLNFTDIETMDNNWEKLYKYNYIINYIIYIIILLIICYIFKKLI
jgi:hypothetical protein